jgi:S-DNA-T family DNA segregation ATPase FtsK/SpoIIIE
MARKPKNKSAKAPNKRVVSQPRMARSRPLLAILFFTVALLSIVAIWDFDKIQSRQVSTEPATNLVGVVGAECSFWAFHFLGVATWLFPVFTAWLGVRFLIQQAPRKRLVTVIAAMASLLCASGLAKMIETTGTIEAGGGIFEHQLSEWGVGGLLGDFFAGSFLEPLLGPFGSFFMLLIGLVVGSIVVFTDNFGRFIDWIQEWFRNFLETRSSSKEEKVKLKAERREAKLKEKEALKAAKVQEKADRAAAQLAKKSKAKSTESEPTAESADEGEEDLVETRSLLRPVTALAGSNSKADPPRKVPKPIINEPEPAVDLPAPEKKAEDKPALKPKLDASMVKIVREEKTEKSVAKIPERRGDYVFPPLDLLAEAPDASQIAPEDHAGTMEALVRTLDEFGVKVIPGEIHTGPVITRYEVKPAPGVRVEKIVNLDKNIALGLKALSVRILAPVPGKGTVGIEVPNKVSLPVCMRDIVESRAWADANAEIPIVLGKDVTGKPMVTDLTKMPHVLIAGSTGSGKTVCINAIIASLLYHSGPEDLRFIMVDPKVVEMQMYNALPHMLIPVVTEAKKVPGALKWLIAEMEQRYQIFAKTNVRNIAGFNAKLAKDKEEQAKAEAMDAEMSAEERHALSTLEVPRDDDAFEIPKKKLPYIVCIIDELADLMMVAPADIETCIARIAQLARAAGIHLILATQRPSVNVITGVIKANLPSRISFKVASKIDSRTILDGGGAEALIGKGDMLFIPPGTSNLVRAQGAFVSDDEINAIVDFLKEKNEPPVFAEEIQRQIDADDDLTPTAGTGEEAGDELLPDAIDVLRSTKRASTSMLQRRLRVGYNRAARLMEELEDRGIVGPENGSSPREILVDLDSV